MRAKRSPAEGAGIEPAICEESCSCLALREAARHVSRLYDEALAPAGVSVNQYSVLARLARGGPCPVSELALSLVMDRSTLGHLLRPLERRGLVGMAPGGDRRQRLVALTQEGVALVATTRPLWQEAERTFRRIFGRARAGELRRLMWTVARTKFGAGEADQQAGIEGRG